MRYHTCWGSWHTPHTNDLPHEAAVDRLCELNVLKNAENVTRTTIIEDAWERGQPVSIHSWIYRLDSGRISVLADPVNADNVAS